MQDKNLVALVIDVSNQPAFVVADVKNNANSNVVGVSPTTTDVPEVFPIRGYALNYLVPGGQGRCPLGMRPASLPNLLSADYAHNESSHFAKIPSSSDLYIFLC